MATKIIKSEPIAKKHHSRLFRKNLLFLAMMSAPAVHAANYEWNGLDITFDTTLSAGITARTESPDSDRQLLSDEIFGSAGDIVSTVFRATHDLDIRKNQTGFFARATYLYDPLLHNEDKLPDKSQDRSGRDCELLDAFFFTRGRIGGIDTYARLGSQVVSWGESTFFVGGINTFNPVDVTKARLPGAEVKEMLTPVPVVLVGASLSQNWSVEGFAQLQWDRTELDPVGTFFNTNDTFGPGAREYNAMGMPKGSDNDADDTGAFGLSTRYIVESLGHTEIGLYHMNYHSTGPFLNLRFDQTGAPVSYFEDFPENIRLTGISFNTGIGAWSVQGETSYRDNLPIATGVATLFGGGGAWERHGYSQTQMTGTRMFPPNVIPTTDQTALVMELGYNRIGGFNEEIASTGVTKEASAMRVMLVPEWHNAFSIPSIGVFNVFGTIDYQYGIDGVGPAAGSGFLERAHMLNLSVEVAHQDKLSFMLAYHTEWGADDINSSRPYNPMHDRDHVQFVAKYSF